MRGKADVRRRGAYTSRITPACAGKSCRAVVRCCPASDHPRVCGEKARCRMVSRDITGSPPRVRGKEKKGFGGFVNTRITPACAGKSGGGIVQHPDKQGSPPRVRGKVCSRRVESKQTRITPACAGKSPYKSFVCQLVEDHPRVCGEKYNISI